MLQILFISAADPQKCPQIRPVFSVYRCENRPYLGESLSLRVTAYLENLLDPPLLSTSNVTLVGELINDLETFGVNVTSFRLQRRASGEYKNRLFFFLLLNKSSQVSYIYFI